jgi:hypothetical protein
MALWRRQFLELAMQKKLTLSINAEIYEALHKMAGKRKIGRFIESLVRPYIESLDGSKERLAQGEDQEAAVLPWTGTHGADAGEMY